MSVLVRLKTCKVGGIGWEWGGGGQGAQYQDVASLPWNLSWLSRGWEYITLRTSASSTATATFTMPLAKADAALPWLCNLNHCPSSARPLLGAFASLSAQCSHHQSLFLSGHSSIPAWLLKDATFLPMLSSSVTSWHWRDVSKEQADC